MPEREIAWLKLARKEFEAFPMDVQLDMRAAPTIAARGGKADTAKPFKGAGGGVLEIALKHRGDASRLIDAVRIGDVLCGCISKEIDPRCCDTKGRRRSHPPSYQATQGELRMSENEQLEVVRGSGNVFRDFGDGDADILHMKAVLAGRIIETLDARKLTVRGASAATGFAAADFSRVRQAKVRGFTLDKLAGMLAKLDHEVEIRVAVTPRAAPAGLAP